MSITIFDIAVHMDELPCRHDFQYCLNDNPQHMEMGFEDAMKGRPFNHEFSEDWKVQMAYELGRLIWFEIKPYKDVLVLKIIADKKQYGNQQR